MIQFAIETRPYPGELSCGDQAGAWSTGPGQLLVALADGIGHGAEAFDAAKRCLKTITKQPKSSLFNLLRACNDSLTGSRGAALGLAKINTEKCILEFSGVGNIRLETTGPYPQKSISQPGILGLEHRIKDHLSRLAFIPGKSTLYLYSDGIQTDTPFELYSPALYPNIKVLANEIVEDWRCDKDDAGLVVIR